MKRLRWHKNGFASILLFTSHSGTHTLLNHSHQYKFTRFICRFIVAVSQFDSSGGDAHTHTHTPLLHRWTFRCCSCSFHWRPQLITKFQNIYVYASRWLPAHKYTNTEKATIDIHIDGDFWWFFQSNSLHRHKTQSPLWMRWKVKHLPSSILLGLHPQQQISSVSGAEIFNFCLHSARSIVKLCELIWYASFILNMYETPRQWTDGPVSIILLYDYVVRFHITNKYLHTQTHNVDL